RVEKAYRFGFRQQAQRPPWRFAGATDFFPRGPSLFSLLRGHRGKGVFGDVRVVWLEGEDALGAEASGKPVDQKTDLAARIQIGIEIGDAGFGAFRAAGREPDEIVAEAGIEWIGKRVEPFPEEAFDNGGIAERRSGLHSNAPD